MFMALMLLKGKLFLLAKALYSSSFRYRGAKASTNMVIVDIKLLSGITADTSPVCMGFKMICRLLRCMKLLHMRLCIYTMVLSSQLGTPPNVFVPLVERVDTGEDHVLVYLKEVRSHVHMHWVYSLPATLMHVYVHRCCCSSVLQVPKGIPMSYTIRLKQVLVVKNIKPGVINVYDYYQTSTLF